MPPKPFKPPRPTPSFKPASASGKKPSKVTKQSSSKATAKSKPKQQARSRSVVVESDEDDDAEGEVEVDEAEEAGGSDEEIEDAAEESREASSVDIHEAENPFASDPRRSKAQAPKPASRRTSTNTPQASKADPKPSRRSTSTPGRAANEPEKENTIPSKLLSVLLKQFMGDGVNISKQADLAMGRYMDVFVREAVARARVESVERGGGRGDEFLEVEDLEKLAPQLILDF